MRSAALPGARSPAQAGVDRGDPEPLHGVAGLCERIARALRDLRDERYVMRREHLLRGPLAGEYRRAWWL